MPLVYQIIDWMFQFLLDWLGLHQREQFALFLLLLLPWFLIYAIRQYSKGRILSIFYVFGALALYAFLFTTSVRVRLAAATVFVLTSAAAFAWYAISHVHSDDRGKR